MIQKLIENRITEESIVPDMDFLFQMFGTSCFPRGELVAVAGKAKSGKSLFLSILMAASLRQSVMALERSAERETNTNLTNSTNSAERETNTNLTNSTNSVERETNTDLTDNTESAEMRALKVMWYDTEQSPQSTKEILRDRIGRIVSGGGSEDGQSTAEERSFMNEHLYAVNVRALGWKERLKMFQAAIPYLKPDLVVLDGVRDLISDINDGKEAQDITEQLMKLAQEHWCCIVCVLHQNKADSDHNLRGWIGTELTNKVFEMYTCEVTAERIFKVKQTLTRKQPIERELCYKLDANTHLPVAAEESEASQPRDAKGRWMSKTPVTDVKSLFVKAMEGRSQRPKRELMAVAMKKCDIEDAKTYYAYFDLAMQKGIIRKAVHPTTGEEWIEMTDHPLFASSS